MYVYYECIIYEKTIQQGQAKRTDLPGYENKESLP